MLNSEIRIPHRADPLSPEEASKAITEALELVHIFIGSYSETGNFPNELIVRSHRFFNSMQGLPGHRNGGCGCDVCYVDKLCYFLGWPPN